MTTIKTIITVCVVFFTITVAHANEMDVLFGNTVELTTATAEGSTTVRLYYNPDGTVDTDVDDVYTWIMRGSDVCTTFKLPNGQDYEACTPVSQFKGAGPGSTWESPAGEGRVVRGKIIPGR